MAGTPPKRRLGTVVLIAAFVALGTGAGWLFRGRPTPPATQHAEGKIKSVLHLESFLLNLADPDERAFLRVGVDLGLETESRGTADGEVPTALVRDTILSVLTQYRPDELLSVEGKDKLKAALLRASGRGRRPWVCAKCTSPNFWSSDRHGGSSCGPTTRGP